MSPEIYRELRDLPEEDQYYNDFSGWFVKGDVSSLETNAPKPKHLVTVVMTPTASYSKYI